MAILTATYNGNTIINTSSDGTFTLPCAGKVMSTDVVLTGSGISSLVATYNGNNIVNTSSDGTFTLKTAGKYMATNIGVSVSGGSAPVVTYITFSSPNSFTLSVVDNIKYWDGTLEYSTNKTTWATWTGTSAISAVSDGTKYNLYMRGTGNTYITGKSSLATKAVWSITGSNVRCDGNIENLLDYATVANGNHPTMADYCYSDMFYGCTSLTTAPALPATSLASYCYQYMFQNCTSLTTAPALPATSLASYCYQYMFYGCTSLTTAPALPATTLIDYCYQYMFSGCTGLTTVTINSGINSVSSNSFSGTFANCPSLLDGFIDLTNITTLSAACAFGGITNSFYPELRFGTQLISITRGNIFKHSTSLSGAMSIRYLFTDNDTPQFTLSNAISKGSSKASITYKIYTDNTAIKDAVLANADQYTTVNVYHLDNSEWGS